MTRELKTALYATAAVIVFVLAFDQYARYPSTVAMPPVALPEGTRTAVVLVHGSGGRDEPTLIALEQRARELAAGAPDVAVLRFAWAPYSDARFRAGAYGPSIGRAAGAQFGSIDSLEAVHLIAHSAGAFVVDPFCEALKKTASRPVRVDVTYLDPIGFRGVLEPGWGAREFGACGDYVEAYINTDDPAPATSTPLARAWTVDVTLAPGKESFEPGGHRWPVQYFLEHATVDDILPGRHDHAQRARGAVDMR